MLTAIAEEKETVLIDRAKRGDCAAFEQLVLKYRSGVTDLVYRMYGDESLAEDCAQTAFIQAWRNLPKFEPRAGEGSFFRSWLFRIALNAALDALRRDKPRVELDEILEASDEEPVEKHVEGRQRRLDVQQAIAELPDASRSVLIMKEYHGMRYQEIAAALDIPLGTVMSRLSYARKSLAGKLSVYLEDV